MIIIKQIKNKQLLIRSLALIFGMLLLGQMAKAQLPGALKRIGSGAPGNNGQSPKGDSLGFEHRDDLKDSITISYRYLDSLKSGTLDSSINDFDRFYTVPANYVTLGNNGTAAFPVLFSPILKAGWDAGFHAFDLYMYSLDNTRFFKTTKPFTQLTYLLASGKEQVISLLHTQNIRPNWNAGIQYRLISSPGFFQTQNTNNNNYRFFSNYQGKKKGMPLI